MSAGFTVLFSIYVLLEGIRCMTALSATRASLPIRRDEPRMRVLCLCGPAWGWEFHGCHMRRESLSQEYCHIMVTFRQDTDLYVAGNATDNEF